MRLPIPTDWTGKWQCYKIWWPDSQSYREILVGFITFLMAGRAWDEKTGIVRAAQAVGWQIFERNYPLVRCNGEPEVKTPPAFMTPGPCAYDGIKSCGDCGGREVTNQPCAPIKVEGGKLYWWNCCEWMEVGTLSPVENDEPIPSDVWERPEQQVQYSACGRAKALVDAIYRVAQGIWEQSDEMLAWQWAGNVEAYAGLGDLKDKYIIEGVIDVGVLQAMGYEEEEVFDLQTRQAILCQLVKRMRATAEPLSDEERNAIDAVFYANCGLEVAVFETAWRAIGTSKLSTIAQLGAVDTSADCECPGELLASVHFAEPQITNVPSGDTVTWVRDLHGKRLTITWNISDTDNAWRSITVNALLVAPEGHQIKFKLEHISGNVVTEEWFDQDCPVADPTAWPHGLVGGPGPGDWAVTITAEDGAQISEYTYGSDEIPDGWYTDFRLCPRTAKNTQSVMRLTIIEYNHQAI